MTADVVGASTWCPVCRRIVEAQFQPESGGYAAQHAVGSRIAPSGRHHWHLRGIGMSS